jgi:hypothetical protein
MILTHILMLTTVGLVVGLVYTFCHFDASK